MIECATASSKGVVSTLPGRTTTTACVQPQHSQLLQRRERECTYTVRERPIGFHQKIYDPLFTSLLGGGGGIFISPMHRGAFCEKGLPCLCMSFTVSEREMKTFPTTILTYWHFTVHRLKALFSQKNKNSTHRFLYSL